MQRIVDWLAASFKRDEGIDLLKDKQALQRLTETAEKAKMELSTLTQTSIRYFAFVRMSSWVLSLSLAVQMGVCEKFNWNFILIKILSSSSLPFITATADGPKHIETTITRAKFEELCSDLLDRYLIFFQTSNSALFS